jgi:hypothetical protein
VRRGCQNVDPIKILLITTSRQAGGPRRFPLSQRAVRCASRSGPDYEYKRNGTVNLFVFLDAHRSWRKVKVTDNRTAVDVAACMRDLTDVHYPKADRMRVVLNNLSTHTAGALYEAFPACEARRVLDRLESHYVPKHASCLTWSRLTSACPRPGPRPPHRYSAAPPIRNPRLGTTAKCRTRPYQMDVHNRQGTKMGRAYPCQTDIRRPKLKES